MNMQFSDCLLYGEEKEGQRDHFFRGTFKSSRISRVIHKKRCSDSASELGVTRLTIPPNVEEKGYVGERAMEEESGNLPSLHASLTDCEIT